MTIILSLIVFAWALSEATVYWIAPDIAIAIAHAFQPKHWKYYLGLSLLASVMGGFITYSWAVWDYQHWLNYVAGMPFHSPKNFAYVKTVINSDSLAIIKAAWGGIPFKLFFGEAAAQDYSLVKILLLGLLSRAIRFSFTLWVCSWIRRWTSPWSLNKPFQYSFLLLGIWASMIALFDMVINKIYL